ncbi:hypothetical protein CK203_099986 [Vitis vinifera]|uniref:Reverse transcriptase zinc-binding domain-containing protein n=1 Tax=Vitis vinifera TaxID=29760 RepID=A0A438DIL3_VITVI|nr:hypothetical protein CK203_099986 [Vitis vinifera]
MSSSCIPRPVRLRVEQIQRDFLWGGGALEQKTHLVQWDTVCLDKRKGGFGYGEEERGWCSREVREGFGVGVWKATRKEWGFVSSRISFTGGWSPSFSRPLNDWEVGSVERFLPCLDEMRVHKDDEDKVLWTETKNGKYTLKSLYMVLESGSSISFPWSNIWKAWVHPRVGFFAWEAFFQPSRGLETPPLGPETKLYGIVT